MPGLTPIPMWLIRSRWPECVPTKSAKAFGLLAAEMSEIRPSTKVIVRSCAFLHRLKQMEPLTVVSGTVNEIEPNGRFRSGTIAWRRASLSNTGLLPSSHSKRLPLRVLMSSTLPFSMICLTLRMRSSNSFTSHIDRALNCAYIFPPLGTRSSSCRTAPGCAIMQLRTCLDVLLVYQHSDSLVPCLESLGRTRCDQLSPVTFDDDGGSSPGSEVH